jgi:hypothetical protein
MSLSPLLVAQRNLHVSNCRFTRFFSPLLYNCYANVARTVFDRGLSAAIYLDQQDWTVPYKEEVITVGSPILRDVTVLNIRSSEPDDFGALWLSAPLCTLSMVRVNVINCHFSTAQFASYVNADSLTIDSLCIYDCEAVEASGISIVGGHISPSIDFVTILGCPSGEYPFGYAGPSGFLSHANVSGCRDQNISCGFFICETIPYTSENVQFSGRYITVWNSTSSTAFLYTCGPDINSSDVRGGLYEFYAIDNVLDTAILVLPYTFSVMWCYFFGNSPLAQPFQSTTGQASLFFAECVYDGQWPALSFVTYTACKDLVADTVTSPFTGLNTRQCIGPGDGAEEGDFWANFTTEEVVSTVICGVALAFAILQVVVYFAKTLCAKDEGLDAPDDDDTWTEDGDEDE